jgi:GT2 family glycosyltransferase
VSSDAVERPMMKVSLVLVTHRSAAVAPAAVASFRREAAALGRAVEVVVVDHSEDPEEERRLGELAPDHLLVRPNRGYAAGLNAGIGAATGEVLLLANPDVELAPGSLGGLLAALGAGWDVVGPQFFLGDFLFPPAEVQTPVEEVRRWLAAASRALGRRYLLRQVGRWRRVWEAPAPVAVAALSGALLAVAAEAAARVGAWDEGYFLYFEEDDWLRRAARAGLALALVPAARVRHAWGHAARPATHGGRFAAARRRYYRRWFGVAGSCVARLPAPAPPRPAPALPPEPDLPAAPGLLWLVSPSPLGFPAAGARGLAGAVHPALARFAAARSHPGPLTVTACDPAARRLLGPWSWEG